MLKKSRRTHFTMKIQENHKGVILWPFSRNRKILTLKKRLKIHDKKTEKWKKLRAAPNKQSPPVNQWKYQTDIREHSEVFSSLDHRAKQKAKKAKKLRTIRCIKSIKYYEVYKVYKAPKMRHSSIYFSFRDIWSEAFWSEFTFSID